MPDENAGQAPQGRTPAQAQAHNKPAESILQKPKADGGQDRDRGSQHLVPPPTGRPTHHKQGSVHAHFVEPVGGGHSGRSRSGSLSDRAETDKKPATEDRPSNNGEPAAAAAVAPSAPTQSTNAPTQPISADDPRLPKDDGKVHILLGATGSVLTGKLRQIILKLEQIYGKDKVSIQLILTKAAEIFVSRGEIPSNVRIWRDSDEWNTWRSRTDPVVHIELRRWADILVIAPLTANTLGKIALGLCDNLLTNVVRAWNTQYPILIAPAMQSYAYNHPATRRHLTEIKENMKWIEVLRPVEKVVGSYGDIGMGGMMDWNEIVNRIVMKLGGYPDVDDDDDDDDKGGDNDDNDDNDDEDEDDDDDDEVAIDDGDDDDDNDDPAAKLTTELRAATIRRACSADDERVFRQSV